MVAPSLSARVKQSWSNSRGKLWRQRVPEIDALNGMRDSLFAVLGTLHGVAYRRGQNATDFTGFTQRQQARKIVLMQARARSVVDEYPLASPAARMPASTESARSAPPSTTVICG